MPLDRSLPPLVLISDATRLGEERFLEVLRSACQGGLSAVQLREPGWSAERLRGFAARVVAEVGEGVLVLVNRVLECATAPGVGGLHVGGGDPRRVAEARRELGPGPLVGYSAHSCEELEQACDAGADYCSLSPVLAPLSKASSLPALGFDGLRDACLYSPLPLYALGGMRPSTVRAARDAGACGVAAMGAILDAADPREVTRQFLSAW